MRFGIVWKNAGLACIVLAAVAIVGYGQTTRQRAHSANIQVAMSAGYLGVNIRELTPERAKMLNLKDDAGVEVTRLVEDAPAVKAGLRLKDVILEVNGQKVESEDQFKELISGKAPGTKINLTVARAGAKQTMVATLALRPPEPPMGFPQGVMSSGPISPEDLQRMIAGDAPMVGFDGLPLGEQLAEYFGVHGGVLVVGVTVNTPADKAGLKAGDVVTKVNGVPVASPREITGVVRQMKKTVFTVVRNKKEITLNVEIAWNRPERSERDLVN